MSVNDDYRSLTRNVLRVFRSAPPEAVQEGMGWYDASFTTAERLAWLTGTPATHAVVALAHLSPRQKWASNVQLLDDLLHGRPRPNWALSSTWANAQRGVRADDPLATFSRGAYKTRAFATAILGDRNAIVVDGWTARVAGFPELQIRTRSGYHMVSEAFIRGARHAGIPPRELQACCWVAMRRSGR